MTTITLETDKTELICLVRAAQRGTAWHVVGCSIFGGTLVVLYTASTLYHSINHSRARPVG